MAESKLKPQAVDAQLIPAAAQTTTAKARAYRNASQSIPSGAETVVLLNTENYDPGNNFNTANGRFTCPVTGWYLVIGSVQNDGLLSGKRMDFGYLSNGSERTYFKGIPSGLAAESGLAGSDLHFHSAGDFLELKTNHNNGSNVNVLGGTSITFMAVHLISI